MDHRPKPPANIGCMAAQAANVSSHSAVLSRHLALFTQLPGHLPLLDLACGSGRNGLYLAAQGLSVVFADRSATALTTVNEQLELLKPDHTSTLWQVDFENPSDALTEQTATVTGQFQSLPPLAEQRFAAIMVFRYLHRPLFAAIKQAVAPGGMIIYETFSREQAHLGRPKNPDFLLEADELLTHFGHWQVIEHFEGIENDAAIARIVARKPLVE